MRSSARTLMVWVVLIVGFMAFYQFFSAPQADGPHTAEAGSGVSAWGCTAATLIAALAAGLWLWRGQQMVKLSQEGLRLLGEGRYTQALERFEAAAKRARQSPVSPYNLGVTQLLLWRTAEAREQFERAWKMLVEEKRGVVVLHAGQPQLVRALVPQYLALTCALEGNLPAAQQWLASVVSPSHPGSGTAQAQVARAALACRAGDFAEATRVLDAFEVKQLGGGLGALANTLRSWAIERTSGELRHVDRVLLFGETGPQMLAHLWPEFAAFVDRAPAA